jgi:hypothetical protein
MRGRMLIALALVCAAVAQAACGRAPTGAAEYTCGHMRQTPSALRDQARVLVDREGLRVQRLSHEEAVLDAEFRIRRACEHAPDAARPYRRAAQLRSPGWLSPASTR